MNRLNQLITIVLVTFNLIVCMRSNGQAISDSLEARRQSGFQYLYDSLSAKIDLAWLLSDAEIMDDSLFLPCDSVMLYNDTLYYDSLGKMHIESTKHGSYYPNYDNYVYQHGDHNLSKEFYEYKQSQKQFNWIVEKFTIHNPPDAWDSLMCESEWNKCYSWVKQPVFNSDFTKMVVETGNYCGMLCGYGFIALFELKNGHWVEVVKFVEWVS